jgi:hypothetical protein
MATATGGTSAAAMETKGPAAPADPPPRGLLGWALLLVLLTAIAWVRVPFTGFAQDDFRWLLRAAENVPVTLATPRPLSAGLYFRAAHALFDHNAVAFHLFHLALHLATGLLFYRVLALRVPVPRAAAAAGLFLTSPALFDALHWVSAITDLLCGFWLAISVWLVIEHGRDRGRPLHAWLSVAAYALALASKEIAVGAAPALALLQSRCPDGAARARALVMLLLAGVTGFAMLNVWERGAGDPYALAAGAPLLNLPGYLAAATIGGAAFASPSDVVWARQAWVIAAGAVLLAAWLLVLLRWNSPGAWPGFIWFTGVLVPVLFLERQVHFFYLYTALPGLVMSLALLAGKGRPAPRWVIGAAAALLVAQVVAIEARATSRLKLAPLPTDFVLRRAAIATNALRDLSPHRDAIRERVVMLGQQPVDEASQGRSTTDPTSYARDPWWDQNVRAALGDGDAIRLIAPRAREVVFAPWLDPGDSASTIVAYQIDGRLRVADYASFVGLPPAGPSTSAGERLARAGSLIQRRLFREALGELEAARAAAPGHPDVLINLGTLQVMLGDSTAALATLGELVTAAPDDLDAAYNLGLLEWRLGRRDQARRTWAVLLERAPGSDLAKAVRDLVEGRAR